MNTNFTDVKSYLERCGMASLPEADVRDYVRELFALPPPPPPPENMIKTEKTEKTREKIYIVGTLWNVSTELGQRQERSTGENVRHLDDAMYFIREAIEAIELVYNEQG